MSKVTIRYQEVGDAKRFFEILNNPNFIYFSAQPKSIEDEEEWLENTILHRNNNFDWNYTILYNNEIVGGVGIKINQHRKYIGEIGYFLDENFWGKGITIEAARLIEKEGFEKNGTN